ncbi:hypothetical protein KOEU_35210 [Komagataeibacter europaeus]|uniref:Uncharacterized protein n=2 Tax=Komagataeibacter TaxID=1434011 RepID=A0A0M0ECN3_KOMEU|nr:MULTISPECIES: hypothetical protein [Komagataeibacter]KDU94328.1 hypothetical protein GLUCORHAEAF1_14545 [Komagataeibacter rhaeticus AF1]KON62988.1 hypothetical protein KOEU_35210 [Komagataeibacter europaeus]
MAAISYIFTAAYVAEKLAEDEDLLHEIAEGMTPEDGRIYVFNSNREDEEPILAFTEFGIENLPYLIEIHKENHALNTKTPGRNTV